MKKLYIPFSVVQKLNIIFLIIVIIVSTFIFKNVFSESLGSGSVPPKTKSNLKTAIKGEKTNSIKFLNYSNLLMANFPGSSAINIAILIKAISVSDSILTSQFTSTIYNLGSSPDAFTNPILDNSDPDFKKYLDDIIQSDFLDYNGFENDAKVENVAKAITDFANASVIKTKRQAYLQNALSAVINKDYSEVAGEYSVCPRCGNIFDLNNVPEVCDICGTANSRFIHVK